jgi:hypothetical protein
VNDRLDTYARYWATMTRASVPELRRLAAPGLRFRDPFNDIVGIDRVVAMLDAMYDTLDSPRFVIIDQTVGAQASYLRWRMTCRPKGRGGPDWVIEGMSEVRFDDEGRVVDHLDHWDAASQFYEHLPVLGTILRWVRRRMAH